MTQPKPASPEVANSPQLEGIETSITNAVNVLFRGQLKTPRIEWEFFNIWYLYLPGMDEPVATGTINEGRIFLFIGDLS